MFWELLSSRRAIDRRTRRRALGDAQIYLQEIRHQRLDGGAYPTAEEYRDQALADAGVLVEVIRS